MFDPSLLLPPDEDALPALAAPAAMPDVGGVVADIQAQQYAADQEALGKGLRAALGIGAIAMVPDVIEELRRSRDVDAKIKFIQMALKEGGYGTKENKHDNLPTFVFNFVGGAGGSVEVVQRVEPQEVVEDAVLVSGAPQEKPIVNPAALAPLAWMNDDFMIPETAPAEESVFDLIA
jgi:hypothetical protein